MDRVLPASVRMRALQWVARQVRAGWKRGQAITGVKVMSSQWSNWAIGAAVGRR
jgi:hypothetical protein